MFSGGMSAISYLYAATLSRSCSSYVVVFFFALSSTASMLFERRTDCSWIPERFLFGMHPDVLPRMLLVYLDLFSWVSAWAFSALSPPSLLIAFPISVLLRLILWTQLLFLPTYALPCDILLFVLCILLDNSCLDYTTWLCVFSSTITIMRICGILSLRWWICSSNHLF